VDDESQEKVDHVSKLFAMKQQNLNRCTRCGREETKESTVLLSNILYSPDGKIYLPVNLLAIVRGMEWIFKCSLLLIGTGGGKRCGFVELLQRSLCPEHTTPAWCDKCGKYQPTYQSRVPKALPPYLSLNTCLDNAHVRDLGAKLFFD